MIKNHTVHPLKGYGSDHLIGVVKTSAILSKSTDLGKTATCSLMAAPDIGVTRQVAALDQKPHGALVDRLWV